MTDMSNEKNACPNAVLVCLQGESTPDILVFLPFAAASFCVTRCVATTDDVINTIYNI
jgi:hypothetical protein